VFLPNLLMVQDLFGRGLSFHFATDTTRTNFFDGSLHGAGLLWQSIKTTPSFQWFKQPYPIITASSIPPIGPAAAAGPFFPGFPIPINGTVSDFPQADQSEPASLKGHGFIDL
jgi:hypothetical protein